MTLARAFARTVATLRLLCVLVLLTLAVTPTLDGLICAGESAPSGSVLIATTLDDTAGGDLDHAICAHGHGHCAALIAPRSSTSVIAPDPGGVDHGWPMLAIATSAPGERLERPPRA